MKQLVLKYPIFISIAWALIILLLCATPGQYIPSMGWLDLLSFDKVVHASIFFIQISFLLLVKWHYHQATYFKVVYVGLTILYGVFLEWMQAVVFVNRSADWMDMVANTFGALIGYLLFSRLHKYLLSS